jgi:hypothetical protein
LDAGLHGAAEGGGCHGRVVLLREELCVDAVSFRCQAAVLVVCARLFSLEVKASANGDVSLFYLVCLFSLRGALTLLCTK